MITMQIKATTTKYSKLKRAKFKQVEVFLGNEILLIERISNKIIYQMSVNKKSKKSWKIKRWGEAIFSY